LFSRTDLQPAFRNFILNGLESTPATAEQNCVKDTRHAKSLPSI